MEKELLEQRYEDLRQYYLSYGAFAPEEQMNLLQILYNMRPSFKQGLPHNIIHLFELIEDQRNCIEQLMQQKESETTE